MISSSGSSSSLCEAMGNLAVSDSATPGPSPSSTHKSSIRVIMHIDVDAFECQVHTRQNRRDADKAFVVANTSGRITAVSYIARPFGITRDHRVHQAKRMCPGLKVVYIPDGPDGKPDGEMARYASHHLLEAIVNFRKAQAVGFPIKFPSSDEFFLDLTELVEVRMENYPHRIYPYLELKTILAGEECDYMGDELKMLTDVLYLEDYKNNGFRKYGDQARLMIGGIIAAELSRDILMDAVFEVSCGIGENMLVAKLATSLNKPKGITILPMEGLSRASKFIKVAGVPGLGSKNGETLCQKLGITTLFELRAVDIRDIRKCFPRCPSLVLDIDVWRRGISNERVMEKLIKDTLGSGKNIIQKFTKWEELALQLAKLLNGLLWRCEEDRYWNKRNALSTRLTLTTIVNGKKKFWNHVFQWIRNFSGVYTRGTLGLKRFIYEGLIYKDIVEMRITIIRFEPLPPGVNF